MKFEVYSKSNHNKIDVIKVFFKGHYINSNEKEKGKKSKKPVNKESFKINSDKITMNNVSSINQNRLYCQII